VRSTHSARAHRRDRESLSAFIRIGGASAMRANPARMPGSMSRRAACLACLACLALARLAPANAYSSLAGSCEHAGVVHGMDQIAPQPGTGGYTLKIGHPGVNVPGATVPVALSGDEAHKGFLVYAVLEDAVNDDAAAGKDADKEMYVGSWDDAAMPDGAQTHPHCAHAATHDAFHNTGIVTDTLPFIVPMDLNAGARVTFKVTVVRDYETWFAFESDAFVVGDARGAGEGDVTFDETTTTTHAPGTRARPKQRAPGLGKAAEGGWRAPSRTTRENIARKTAAPTSVGGERGSSVEDHGGSSTTSAPVSVGGRKVAAGATKSPGTAPLADPLADQSAISVKRRRRNARLAHGLAMGIAWLFFAPSGALVARHGKASKTWFSTHKASGLVVTALTLISAWYITRTRGWSTPWGKHGKTGGFVIILTLLQALGGYYRKRFPRSRWSAWHRITGVTAIFLGAYNCLAGASMLLWMEVGYGGVLVAARVAAAAWACAAVALELRKRGRGVARKRGRMA
jgi:hypothetical protein